MKFDFKNLIINTVFKKRFLSFSKHNGRINSFIIPCLKTKKNNMINMCPVKIQRRSCNLKAVTDKKIKQIKIKFTSNLYYFCWKFKIISFILRIYVIYCAIYGSETTFETPVKKKSNNLPI